MRRRLDDELVARGVSPNIEEARQAITGKVVLVNGAPALKFGALVSPADRLQIVPGRQFVSRSGQKLEGALDDLGVNAAGKRCLDAGAGSGGFTECLLRCGAASVVAVDVGYGQFDWAIRNDPKVTLMERTNIRDIKPHDVAAPLDLVVADLSFMSLRSVVPSLAALAVPGGALLLMVKPQHEAPRADVGPGGIVRDPDVWRRSIGSVVGALDEVDFPTVGVAPARIKGAEGNQEFFVLALHGAKSDPEAIERAVRTAT